MPDIENQQRLWQKWISTPEGKAQEKLFTGLSNLRNDPEIRTSQLCRDFLELVLGIAPHVESESLSDLVDPMTPYFKKVDARKNAIAGHKKNNQARDFVFGEWRKYRKDYQDNKSAFARDYVRRVFNEFSVTVTEKQLREVWLKDTPSASKPAG